MSEISQIIEKAIFYAQIDAYYLLPVIGSIQIFIIGALFKKKRLIYLSIFLFVLYYLQFLILEDLDQYHSYFF